MACYLQISREGKEVGMYRQIRSKDVYSCDVARSRISTGVCEVVNIMNTLKNSANSSLLS